MILPDKHSHAHKRWILLILGIKTENLLFNYLGAPLYVGKKKWIHIDRTLTRIRGAIQGWSTKFLSYGGKHILIRHALASIPLYLMLVLSLPKSSW